MRQRLGGSDRPMHLHEEAHVEGEPRQELPGSPEPRPRRSPPSYSIELMIRFNKSIRKTHIEGHGTTVATDGLEKPFSPGSASSLSANSRCTMRTSARPKVGEP